MNATQSDIDNIRAVGETLVIGDHVIDFTPIGTHAYDVVNRIAENYDKSELDRLTSVFEDQSSELAEFKASNIDANHELDSLISRINELNVELQRIKDRL